MTTRTGTGTRKGGGTSRSIRSPGSSTASSASGFRPKVLTDSVSHQIQKRIHEARVAGLDPKYAIMGPPTYYRLCKEPTVLYSSTGMATEIFGLKINVMKWMPDGIVLIADNPDGTAKPVIGFDWSGLSYGKPVAKTDWTLASSSGSYEPATIYSGEKTVVDATVFGDTTKTYLTGLKEITGTFSGSARTIYFNNHNWDTTPIVPVEEPAIDPGTDPDSIFGRALKKYQG